MIMAMMKLNKGSIFIVLFFALGFIGKAHSQNFLYTTLTDMEGNTLSLDEAKGEKLTVLDFWATWCKPCVKSIPEMVKISHDFSDKGVKFIGVNEDSPRNQNKVRPFANSLGIDYQVVLDEDQEIMTELVVSVLPTFIVMNGEGKIIYTHEGFLPGDEELIRQKIEELLDDAE